MAAGNYWGTKAELGNLRRLRDVEERHVRETPEGERLEMRAILAAKGLEGEVLEKATNAIPSDKRKWIEIMLDDEYGPSSVQPHPLCAAIATCLAFLAAGLVPPIPFPVEVRARAVFRLSPSVTSAAFFTRHWRVQRPLVVGFVVEIRV